MTHPFADPSADGPFGVLPRPFDPAGSSFAAVLAQVVPDAVRAGRVASADPATVAGLVAEGTTVLAVRGQGGVVIAGDRRATSGHLIARADLRKVFATDDHSAVAISGAAGPAMELARVLATELEHYEKVEGEPLTLEGKSSRLAGLLRANLPLTLQGLVVVPLFAGVDPRTGVGAIHEYDPIGGRYVAAEQAVAGSGSLAARSTLRRLADNDAPLSTAAATAVEALVVAAEDDAATGGPDPARGIWPIVAVIDVDGYRELPEDAVAALVAAALEGRRR